MQNTYTGYKVAELSAHQVETLNQLASGIKADSSNEIVLIAYEKDRK